MKKTIIISGLLLSLSPVVWGLNTDTLLNNVTVEDSVELITPERATEITEEAEKAAEDAMNKIVELEIKVALITDKIHAAEDRMRIALENNDIDETEKNRRQQKITLALRWIEDLNESIEKAKEKVDHLNELLGKSGGFTLVD